MPQDRNPDFNIADPDTWPLALKFSEVAEILRVTESVVRDLVERERLRAIPVSPGEKRPAVRVPRRDVLVFLGEIPSDPQGQILQE